MITEETVKEYLETVFNEFSSIEPPKGIINMRARIIGLRCSVLNRSLLYGFQRNIKVVRSSSL